MASLSEPIQSFILRFIFKAQGEEKLKEVFDEYDTFEQGRVNCYELPNMLQGKKRLFLKLWLTKTFLDLNEKNSSKQVYDLFKEWGIKETETVDFSTFQKFYQTIVDSNKWIACNILNFENEI